METGLSVLAAFIGSESSMTLKALSERTEMSPPKVHRYLVSLCRSRFVQRDPATAQYSLGESALRIGMTALGNAQIIRIAKPVVVRLSNEIAQTALLAVWSSAGATVVLEEVYAGTITVTTRVGSALPCLTSATGRMFCAWLSREVTQPMIDKELAAFQGRQNQDNPTSVKGMEALLDDIRKRGLARTVGGFNPDVNALSAPIVDVDGQLCAVLCALGPARSFNADWDGPIATKLASAALALSTSMGYQATSAAKD